MAKKEQQRKRKKVLVTFQDDEVDLFARYQQRRAITIPEGTAVRELAVQQMNEFFKKEQAA